VHQSHPRLKEVQAVAQRLPNFLDTITKLERYRAIMTID